MAKKGIKMGMKKSEIINMANEHKNVMGQGDITDKYSDMMFSVPSDKFVVDSVKQNNKESLEQVISEAKDKIVEIEISKLSSSPKNAFSLPTGEKREEFLGSLKSYGQINPIIIRPKEFVEDYKDKIENEFEILQGHSRVHLLKELGESKVKAVIVKCNDIEATLIINQSNIQREGISELEQARAYKFTYEALKKDKNANLKNVEISTDLSSTQIGYSREESKRTIEIVAEKYGISKNTLQRKMALANCNEKVVYLYENKKLTQAQMIILSKMSEAEQEYVLEALKEAKLKMTKEISEDIYEAYKKAKKDGEHKFGLNTIRRLIADKDYTNKESVKNTKLKKEKPVEKEVDNMIKTKDNENIYILEDELFPNIEDKQGWLVNLLKRIRKGEIKV